MAVLKQSFKSNVTALRQRVSIEQAAPWIVSGATTIYVVARARRLSRADPTDDPFLTFLLSQSDIVLTLCGSPVIYYVIQQRRSASPSVQRRRSPDPFQIRQLRQVLSVLLLGIGLLERRLAHGAYNELNAILERLRTTVQHGAEVLKAIESA